MTKRWIKIWATAWALIAAAFLFCLLWVRFLIYAWILDCYKYGHPYYSWSLAVPMALIVVCLGMLIFEPAREMIRQIENKNFHV